MHSIKYVAEIRYTEIDGEETSVKYSFYAVTEKDAKVIAKELFFATNGVLPDMVVNISPVVPDKNELTKVNSSLVKDFKAIKTIFEGLTYAKFLNLFIELEGWGFQISSCCVSFYFKLRNYVCKAEFKSGKSGVACREVLYYGDRVYVLRNNLSEVYIGGML